MRVFGNLMNRLQEHNLVKPEFGMGATINMHSDRHAATIIALLSPTRVMIQQDIAKLVSGSRQSESQEYEFLPNVAGRKRVFSLRKNKVWVEEGAKQSSGTSLTIGERDEYYDPSF